MYRYLSLLLLAALLAAAVPRAHAQSQGAATDAAAAFDLYARGQYAAAAAAYEKVLQDYPTDASIPSVENQLAFVYYALGKYDQALATLNKVITSPLASAALKQTAAGLVPQIALAQATLIPTTDPRSKSAYADAAAKFSAYIQAYPQADDLEDAYFNRATAEYQAGDYDAAVKDLQGNIQRYPTSSTLPNTKNFLALTLATIASQSLAKGGGDTAQALTTFDQAAALLREIIAKKEDVALINDANFRLGEILFNEAAVSPKEKQAAFYQQAMEAYKAVVPKEQIVAWQQQVVQGFPERRRQALLRKDDAALKRIDKDSAREVRKLNELQNRPDQTVTALLKMGQIFFQQGFYNEARVILEHITPFLQSEDDKKKALYFLTLTYAAQNQEAKALEDYASFQAKYKGDPIAENLPLAIGNMMLQLNKPQDAVRYLDESLSIYPSGHYTDLSLIAKANAATRNKDYDNARQSFEQILAKNPNEETALAAQSGLADNYRSAAQWDNAISAYQTIKQKYPNSDQAKAADYWIAACTQQKGDNAGSITLYDTYLGSNPTNDQLHAMALFGKGRAQIAVGDKEGGIASLAELAEKFPQSQVAAFTYFLRANERSLQNKPDEVIALMKQYVQKYPQDSYIFTGYDTLAQTLIAQGKVDEGLAAYREYAQKNAENPQAAEALNKVADLQRTQAEKLGRYGALSDAEKAQWKPAIDGSITTSEEIVQKYPNKAGTALALQNLLKIQKMMVEAGLKKDEDIPAYFTALAGKTTDAQAKSQIMFTLAQAVDDKDPAKAAEMMAQAYDPTVIYAPEAIEIYGLSLIKGNKAADADAVFQKLAADFPNPPGAQPAQAPLPIQTAQATALFGRGSVAQAQNNAEQAGQYFQQLKTLYPWSPKVMEANFGIADSLVGQAKFDDALALLVGIIQAPNAPAPLRAKAYLLGGKVMAEKMKAATDAPTKSQLQGAAIDYFVKIGSMFASEKQVAAEGLWLGSQMLEQQAADQTDPNAKKQSLNRAREFYGQLVKSYPDSEYAAQAQERLTALGPAQK